MTISPQLIAATIQGDSGLARDIENLVSTYPDTAAVITRLLTHFQTKQAPPRPKIDQGISQYFTSNNNGNSSSASSTSGATPTISLEDLGPSIYSTAPLSFLHPVRKKLVLSLHPKDIVLLSATNLSEPLFSAPYRSLYRVAAVPFLERTAKHTALILFFRHSGISTNSPKDAIWAVPLADDGKDFSLEFHSQHKQLAGLTDDLRLPGAKPTPVPLALTKRPDHILTSILSYFTHKYNPTRYSTGKSNGDMVDFIPNPTPAYPNFSAHLKSNQGTIYLLPTGILFAFKKPILFLRSEAIESIGIFSVMSRTFDFEVVMDSTSGVSTPEDLEGVPIETKGEGRRAVGFGMVDTKEFARMEDWIKKSGIRDRSLSEDLKAKDKAPASVSGSKKRERTADGGDLSDTGSQGSSSQKSGVSASKKKKKEVDDEDDDDDEDQDFAPESEDEIMEEYDSEAEGSSGSGSEGENNVQKKTPFKTAKNNRRVDEEEDLEEESLGEDTEDDDDEDEDEDDEVEEDEEDDEVEEDEVQEEPKIAREKAAVMDEEEDEEEDEDEETYTTARHENDDEEEIDELIDDE
ncbi:hypothetical protein BGZ76_010618 [Entomortierella beljakovae]|nr:hypothetical protein BGZ76_010618 [Entomortierella beljakovae]